MSLKVVTINILIDLSRWRERGKLLLDGLSRQQADLIALQEASLKANNAAWLAESLEMPYLYVSPKTGKAGAEEGIAILSRLPFEAQETLDLRTQNRVAQYVQVRYRGMPVVFSNGHFFWQPGEAPERIQQVELLLNWLQQIPDSPASIVCGDFNTTPGAESMRRMRERYVSAYAAVHGREPEYTSPTPLPRSKLVTLRIILRFLKYIRPREIDLNWRGTLDYIFISPQLQVRDCQLILNQPAPDQPKIYPSDHFGLAASLDFNQP